MDKHEALDWFLRRKSMCLDDKCQAAEDIAIECIMRAIDSDWISVKERLPNDYQPVMVSDGEEPEFAIFYDHYNGYGPTFVTPDCYEEERIEGITHWMPLPEPPKEET